MTDRDTAPVEALYRKAVTEEAEGRLGEAERLYREVLARHPDHAEALDRLGFLALLAGQAEAARQLQARALALAADLPGRHRHTAQRLEREGQAAAAGMAWRRVLALTPRDAEALTGVAGALLAEGRYAEAASAAAEATALAPASVEAHERHGIALREMGEPAEAEAAYRRGLGLAPGESRLHLGLGLALRDRGRLAEAENSVRHALDLDPGSAEAWLHLSELHRFDTGAAEIGRMEALMARLPGASPAEPALRFALAKALDDIGDYDRAFFHLERGNRLMRRRLPYDPARDEGWAERIIRGFTPEFLAARRVHGDPSELPVLILGMPRSGSTLVEQILACHRQVHGAGEIPEVGLMLNDLARIAGPGGDFLDGLARLPGAGFARLGAGSVARLRRLAPAAARITNKTPGNIFNVGLVHLALPNARFVLTRRDPVETCFACYRMLFSNGVAFSYDLRDVARYWRATDKLARHWQGLLPERTAEIVYEGLVADPEGEVRRLLAFLGLDYDPACLAFHESDRPVQTASAAQIRQPLAKAPSRRWRNYERHLGPLLDALDTEAST